MNEKELFPSPEHSEKNEVRRPVRRPVQNLSPFSTEEKAEKILSSEEAPVVEERHFPEEDDSDSEPQSTETETEARNDPQSVFEEKAPSTDDKAEQNDEALSGPLNTFDWIKTFILCLTVIVFLFTLVFRGVTVNGNSMLPTLQNGEYLIISDLLYTPETGDIVVVQSPYYKNGTEPLIKRVIATGGQTVTINFSTWEVWVDGALLKEDYILRDDYTTMNCEDLVPDENGIATVVVEENSIFVMGDNRNDSLDSRSLSVGQIHERYIMGRLIVRLAPINRFGRVH